MKFLYRKIIITITIILLINSTIFAEVIPPQVIGEGILLLEPSTNSIVFSRNPDKRLYPASTTKLITALVTLDYFAPDEVILTGEEVDAKNLPPNSSTAIGIAPGQTLTIETALKGLLLSSGNDVACTLALNVLQKKEKLTNISYSEAEKKFATLMNEKAKELGALNSNFVNPHGYHNDNHYTTARDLSIITQVFLRNNLLSDIVKLKNFKGDGADREMYSGKKIVTYNWANSNNLISSSTYKYEYATGVKTGYTGEAGRCLIASAEKDGVQLIAIILNSTDPERWMDAKALFEYGFNNFKIDSVHKKGDILDTVTIRDNSFKLNQKIQIFADEDLTGYILANEPMVKELNFYENSNISSENQPPKLKLPIILGQTIGTVSYKVGDEVVLKQEIKASNNMKIDLNENIVDYKKAGKRNTQRNIINFIKTIFFALIVAISSIMGLGILRGYLIKKRRRMRIKRRRYAKRV